MLADSSELVIIEGLINQLRDDIALMHQDDRSKKLGFSSSTSTTENDGIWLFINQPRSSPSPEAFFYKRDKQEAKNKYIFHDQLNCFLDTVYRRNTKDSSGANRPTLNAHLRADKLYILQTGFRTYFASTLLAALAKLPEHALGEMLTLKVEHHTGTKGFPSAYCQIVYQGERVERIGNPVNNKEHLQSLHERHGFVNPISGETGLEAE